ncbi:hypothetical protein GJW-30_1_01628 [Variibacter gotjawalensis]|uniref:Uncharacterized protein n=1 Tax=Variibacter gotjawalensis TaxID=1333996 RepID=A0A0S3PT52_9BRAD|nr:hypothetical protein [Variibacter gotjawalensis]NIK49414.1 hypothetical protein [Variibacter gotjawalensis]RZS51266.1 hypothetical protein EV661_3743 [Variibacter gotjawalensis]BAT59099.1 hypothetical protein GJW-30_1_01628 [Variibacter gotjawalensis]
MTIVIEVFPRGSGWCVQQGNALIADNVPRVDAVQKANRYVFWLRDQGYDAGVKLLDEDPSDRTI